MTKLIDTAALPTNPIIGVRIDTINPAITGGTIGLQARIVGKFGFYGPKGNA